MKVEPRDVDGMVIVFSRQLPLVKKHLFGSSYTTTLASSTREKKFAKARYFLVLHIITQAVSWTVFLPKQNLPSPPFHRTTTTTPPAQGSIDSRFKMGENGKRKGAPTGGGQQTKKKKVCLTKPSG